MRQEWTRQRQNYTEGDIGDIAGSRDDQGQVRSVTVQSAAGSVLSRPVNKLVLLLESPKDRLGIPNEEPEDHL